MDNLFFLIVDPKGPYLFPHWELSPLDLQEPTLQLLFDISKLTVLIASYILGPLLCKMYISGSHL